MADGPTVQQILKKRDAGTTACEATAQQDRAKRNAVMPSLTESLKGMVGFSSADMELRLDLYKIDSVEKVCKAKAQIEADADLTIREATLHSDVQVLATTVQRQNRNIKGYQEALDQADKRVRVAETLAEACFFPKRKSPPPPASKGHNGPQEATMRKPTR